MISKLLSSLYIVPVHTHARVQNTNNLINLGKKKRKKGAHIFFTNTFSWQKKGGRACEQSCVSLSLLESSFVCMGVRSFYPTNVMEAWSS